MSRAWKLLCWFLLIISPAALRGAGSASTQKPAPSIAPSDRVVVMDKMVVTAVRDYHWRYAKSAHFEILSNCADDSFVIRVVQYAEKVIEPYEKNLAIYQSDRELPARLIFIEEDGIERLLTPTGATWDVNAIGSTWGDHPDKPLPLQGYRFTRLCHGAINAEQIMIICRNMKQFPDNPRYPLAWKVTAYGIDIAVDYLKKCLEGRKITGLPSMYPAASINNWPMPGRITTISVNRFDYYADLVRTLASNDYEERLVYAAFVRRWMADHLDGPLLNLRAIVESTGSLPVPAQGCSVADARKYISFQRQERDFSFYCTFGPNPRTRDGFVNWLKHRSKRVPITEDVFKQYFGARYGVFTEQMYDFYRNSSPNPILSNDGWGMSLMWINRFYVQEAPRITLADATRSQSARIISDWFFINNQPDIARRTLSLAVSDVPKVRDDPEFCAALGLSELQYGDKAAALPLLEKAAGAKIKRPEVYRSLSRLYLENILASKGTDYKLDAREVQKVNAPLSAALKLSQSNPQTYLQVLELMRHADKPLPKKFWETMVTDCVRQFPDNFDLLNQLVPLLLKNGFGDEATRLLDAAVQCPLTDEEQQQLERLGGMFGGQ